jgi:hypothetical protein
MEVFNVAPRPLYPRENPSTHCIGVWVGPRAGLNGCGKSRHLPGFDPRTFQPVASCYNDWAISAQKIHTGDHSNMHVVVLKSLASYSSHYIYLKKPYNK